MELTKEYLNWLFDYDQERGVLIWKNHWCRNRSMFLGKQAGWSDDHRNTSYNKVNINQKNYKVHQLIWVLEGRELTKDIDHIDGNGLNNHISNLRLTTNRKNCQNRHYHRAGRLVGASLHTKTKLWRSRIYVEGKEVCLGYFKTAIEAHHRYNVALKEFGAS